MRLRNLIPATLIIGGAGVLYLSTIYQSLYVDLARQAIITIGAVSILAIFAGLGDIVAGFAIEENSPGHFRIRQNWLGRFLTHSTPTLSNRCAISLSCGFFLIVAPIVAAVMTSALWLFATTLFFGLSDVTHFISLLQMIGMLAAILTGSVVLLGSFIWTVLNYTRTATTIVAILTVGWASYMLYAWELPADFAQQMVSLALFLGTVGALCGGYFLAKRTLKILPQHELICPTRIDVETA